MKKSLLAVAVLFLAGCSSLRTHTEPNTLTSAEKRHGWKLLFDGKTPGAWHNIGKTAFPEKGWVIEDGTLRKLAKVRGGDLITDDTYSEFDLKWEWKIAPKGNNGVKYYVTDDRKGVGHEYQMLDDATEPEGKDNGKHSTASFYDVLPPWPNKPAALHPAVETRI